MAWVSSGPEREVDLESLVAELLEDMYLPTVNCLPVKKPFGALKELVLPALQESSMLPYTATSALWLLRRLGKVWTQNSGSPLSKG